MGARRLGSLVMALPPESAVARSYTGGIPYGWGEETLTVIVELLHATLRTHLRAYGAKPHQLPKPLDVERPWQASERAERKRRRRAATVEEAAAVMGGMGFGIGAPADG